MKFAVIAALVATTSADLCCVKCGVDDEKIKAFSVDTTMNLCGEACMMKKDYWKYHIFEKNLKLADDPLGTPCADLGYTDYINTVTHGVPHIFAITLDLFNTTQNEQPVSMDAEPTKKLEMIKEDIEGELKHIVMEYEKDPAIHAKVDSVISAASIDEIHATEEALKKELEGDLEKIFMN